MRSEPGELLYASWNQSACSSSLRKGIQSRRQAESPGYSPGLYFLLYNFYLVQLYISFQHSALLNYITLFPVFQGNPKIFQKIEKSSHYSGSFILSYFFTKYSSYQTRNVYIVQILRQLSEFPFTYSRNIAFISSVSKNSAAVSLLNLAFTSAL